MRRLVLVVTAVATLAAARPASAEIFGIFGQAKIGYANGAGLGGDLKDANFFEGAKGFTYGILVGAQILFLRGWIDHHQYTDFSNFKGTWTQFMLGSGFELPLGDVSAGIIPFNLGLTFGAGFGLGTGQQVTPPLDSGQVTDKGLVAEATPALKYKFNSIIALGVEVPITVGLLWKSNAPVSTSSFYTAYQVKGLAFLEVSLGF